VGREYIISSNFMPPYGIPLADSTIVKHPKQKKILKKF
jgi:hypothetical protein